MFQLLLRARIQVPQAESRFAKLDQVLKPNLKRLANGSSDYCIELVDWARSSESIQALLVHFETVFT
jgi:hypothetical protein